MCDATANPPRFCQFYDRTCSENYFNDVTRCNAGILLQQQGGSSWGDVGLVTTLTVDFVKMLRCFVSYVSYYDLSLWIAFYRKLCCNIRTSCVVKCSKNDYRHNICTFRFFLEWRKCSLVNVFIQNVFVAITRPPGVHAQTLLCPCIVFLRFEIKSIVMSNKQVLISILILKWPRSNSARKRNWNQLLYSLK